MKSNRLFVLTLALLLLVTLNVTGQKKAKREPLKHEQEVRDMVSFLQYMLNTLGDATTSSRDKDVMVTDSYAKIFRDGKVQVEDDLDENRTVITNKDVQAYLKDVDFFFKDVKFEFNIEDIDSKGTEADRLFYKVKITRNLKGTTVEGKSINNTIPRYIEINYDSKEQDLKIVSIYTNEFKEKDALKNWWNELSYEWQAIFKVKLDLGDTVSLEDIKAITAIDTLDLSGNYYIQNIDPLAQLLDLSTLNLSRTTVTDLSPIRNLTELKELNLSKTRVEDLSPLRYSINLRSLNINETPVRDIAVVEKFTNLITLEARKTAIGNFAALTGLVTLETLNLEGTPLTTLDPIQGLVNLKTLLVGKTAIQNLDPLSHLVQLTNLNVDSTRIQNIRSLASLSKLQVVHLNNTSISDLEPLMGLSDLQRIYCDHTGIKQEEADAYMASRPTVLVIFDSDDLSGWWHGLSPVWRDVLSRTAKVGFNPTKEELAKVTNLDSVNFSNYALIKNLDPIKKLQKLHVIIASRSGISDLSPLANHREVRYLDISYTQVSDLQPLKGFSALKVLRADNSKVRQLDTTVQVQIEKFYVDNTGIQDAEVQQFLKTSPGTLVVYKTDALKKWWSQLSEEWKQILKTQIKIDGEPTREILHQLAELETFQFGNVPINDLSPLREFVRLRSLSFNGTSVSNVSLLGEIRSLRSLQINDNPIRDIEPLAQLTELEVLDISNTPVTEIDRLSSLKNMKSFSCAGTPIKKLNPLKSMEALEYLDCSNTDVKKLSPVFGLPLKTLKCYNTKVSKKEVKAFQRRNPGCNVVYYR